MHSKPSQVVIYGGGMAGALLAKALAPTFRITLVDPNDYFEVPMAAPRSLVKPAFADGAIFPFSAILPDVHHVRGMLTELTPGGGRVQLPNGEQELVAGQISVLATGSAYANALMRARGGASGEERKTFYRRFHTRLDGAQRILIVGGGPIGVEVAGEIVETYPGKALTLLEAGPRLMAGTSEEAAAFAAQFLRGRGVTILTNERFDSAGHDLDAFSAAGEVRTSLGRTIPYDLMIWCTGGKPNTRYMANHYPSSLNAAGRIRVTPDLRVAGHQGVFALGDITDLDENKMAWHIAGQVKTAAYNIRTLLAGDGRPGKLKAYKAQTGNPKMAVTLGSRDGVVHLPGLGVIRWPAFARMAKSGHMLVPKYRKVLGA